jgi:hypothetical protein
MLRLYQIARAHSHLCRPEGVRHFFAESYAEKEEGGRRENIV